MQLAIHSRLPYIAEASVCRRPIECKHFWHSVFELSNPVLWQVYRHHCVSALSAKHQRWRDCAIYIVKNINAVKWALDFCGFRDVAIPVHSMQVNSTTDGAQSAVLVNIRFSVQLAL